MLNVINESRSCGECTACCKVMIVPELNKPANFQCQYSNEGCDIYDHRPPTCRDWNCLWIEGHFGDKDRPDKTRFVSWLLPRSQSKQWDHPVIAMREIKEGSTVVPAGDRAIKKLNKNGCTVLVIKKDSGRVIHPAKGFREKLKSGLDSQGVDYKFRGGKFYLSREYCEEHWPIDYADESSLKKELSELK
jgi:hypothetical protein